MKKLIITGAIVGSMLVPSAASAHYVKVTPAREAATQVARDVYLETNADDYGYAACKRQSAHRVSCLAVVTFEDGSSCEQRVYIQSRAARYQYVTTYGRVYCGGGSAEEEIGSGA